MIRPQRNVKFLPQTEKWFVGDDACIVPNDGLYRIYYHIILRTTVGAQCVPLRVGYALRQHRIIPALRLKHRSGGCGTASALPKCSIMSGCGTRIVLRGQKPLALCDRCPCFGSLFPPLAALTFAASSIICAFGLASAAPRSPYRHLELCGVAQNPKPIPRRPGGWPPYSLPSHEYLPKTKSPVQAKNEVTPKS